MKGELVSQLVGALNPVNHEGLHQGWNKKEWASLVALCQKHKPQYSQHVKVSTRGLSKENTMTNFCPSLKSKSKSGTVLKATRKIKKEKFNLPFKSLKFTGKLVIKKKQTANLLLDS